MRIAFLDVAAALTDAELIQCVKTLVANERHTTAELIAHLAEVDARRLYLREGCSSLFTYCTQVLHLAEHAAYGRIEAARAARKWPLIIDLIGDGSLHLTAVGLLAPHLTLENHRDVLAAATHKSKRQVEELVASLRPRLDVPSTIRKLPALMASARCAHVITSPSPVTDGAAITAAASPAVDPSPTRPAPTPQEVTPLAPARYKVQFTVSGDTHQKLREVQDLLRHAIPNADVAEVFERALTLLLAELRRTRHAATDRPRPAGSVRTGRRHIPAAVKREVWARDGGRCAFIGTEGRCSERGFLEYHHVVPFADGGPAAAHNLELRCRAHNAYEAERRFGRGEEFQLRERGSPYWLT